MSDIIEKPSFISAKNLVHVSLTDAIGRFLADIAAGHSAATASTYKTGLSRFTYYLATYQNIDPTLTPVAELQTDWAVECVRWIAAGQPNMISSASITSNNPARVPTSKATTATYVAAIGRFYRWAAGERLLDLPTDEYERMSRRMKDLRGKVKRTILSKVPEDSVLKALLVQARQPYKAVPQSETVIDGKGQDEESKADRRRNVQASLKAYDATRYELIRLRNTALLECLKSTGARVSEVCSLTRGDLDYTNHRAHVVGKGSKERWLYFSPTAWSSLEAYLARRGQLIGVSTKVVKAKAKTSASEGSVEDAQRLPNNELGTNRRNVRRPKASEVSLEPLFGRHDRSAGLAQVKAINPRAIQLLLWELVEAAGLSTTITPHKFRHWFATHLLASTGDLAATQDLLGHASPNTTRIYAQVSEQKKQDIHRSVFND